MTPSWRLFTPDLRDGILCDELLLLQEDAYQRELRRAGIPGPVLVDSPAELRASGERFLAAEAPPGSPWRLAGVLAWTRDGATVEPVRLMVRLELARRGVARALMMAMLGAEASAERAVLEVAEANEPARALYESLSFTPVSRRTVAPGIVLSRMERGPQRGALTQEEP